MTSGGMLPKERVNFGCRSGHGIRGGRRTVRGVGLRVVRRTTTRRLKEGLGVRLGRFGTDSMNQNDTGGGPIRVP